MKNDKILLYLIIGLPMNLSTQEFFDLVSEENKKTLLISFAKKNLNVALEYLDYIKSHYSKTEEIKIFNDFLENQDIPESSLNVLLPIIKEEIKVALFQSNERAILSEKSIQYFQKKEGIDFTLEVISHLKSNKMIKKFLALAHDNYIYEPDYFTIKDDSYEAFKNALLVPKENKFVIENNDTIDFIAKNNYSVELFKEFNQEGLMNNLLTNNYYNLETFLFNLMKNPFVSLEEFKQITQVIDKQYHNEFEDKLDEDNDSEISIYFVENTIPKNQLELDKFGVMHKVFQMTPSVSSFEDLIEMKKPLIKNMIETLKLTKKTNLYSINDILYNSYELAREDFFAKDNIDILFELIKFSKTTIKEESKLFNKFLSQLKTSFDSEYKKGNFDKEEVAGFLINFENQLLNETLKEEPTQGKKHKI
jgi:hypothetical protein